MTGPDWSQLSHRQLYEAVQSGPGRAISVAAEERWTRIEAVITGIEQRISAALARSNGGWEGAAADATRTGISPLGAWALDAAGDARLTAGAILSQGEHAAELRRLLPPPESEPGPIAGRIGVSPHDAARQAAAAADAKRLMHDYANHSYENDRYLDYWTVPPSVTVDSAPIGPAGTSAGAGPGPAAVGSRAGGSGPGDSGAGVGVTGPLGGAGAAGPGGVGRGAVGGAGASAAGTGLAGSGAAGAGHGGGGSGTGGHTPTGFPPGGRATGGLPGGGYGPGGSGSGAGRTGLGGTGLGATGLGRTGLDGTGSGGTGGGRSSGAAVGAPRLPTSGQPGTAGGYGGAGDAREPTAGGRGPSRSTTPLGGGTVRPVVPEVPRSNPVPGWRDLVPDSEQQARPTRPGSAAEPVGRTALVAEEAARPGGSRAGAGMGMYPPMTTGGAGSAGGEHRRPGWLVDTTGAFDDDRWFSPAVITPDDG